MAGLDFFQFVGVLVAFNGFLMQPREVTLGYRAEPASFQKGRCHPCVPTYAPKRATRIACFTDSGL